MNTLTHAEGNNRWTAGSDVDVAIGVASYELLLRRRQLGKYSSVVGIPALGKRERGRGEAASARHSMELLWKWSSWYHALFVKNTIVTL